jgi:hypothetical protein
MRFPARRLKHGNTPSKYRNRKTEVDGIVFDSAKEARRWQELQLLERAGEIKSLRRQVPIVCEVNGQLVCKWVSDFAYQEFVKAGWHGEDVFVHGKSFWREVFEDVKSAYTRKLPVYRLKAKLVQALHGITIRES